MKCGSTVTSGAGHITDDCFFLWHWICSAGLSFGFHWCYCEYVLTGNHLRKHTVFQFNFSKLNNRLISSKVCEYITLAERSALQSLALLYPHQPQREGLRLLGLGWWQSQPRSFPACCWPQMKPLGQIELQDCTEGNLMLLIFFNTIGEAWVITRTELTYLSMVTLCYIINETGK